MLCLRPTFLQLATRDLQSLKLCHQLLSLFQKSVLGGSSSTACPLQPRCQLSSLLWGNEPSEGPPRAGRRMGGQSCLVHLHCLKCVFKLFEKDLAAAA